MKKSLALALCLSSIVASAQAPQVALVTERDGLAVLGRVEQGLRRTIGLPDTPARTGGTEVLSRTKIVNEFYRIYTEAKPLFRVTPMPFEIDRPLLQERVKDAATRAKLETLILAGCIPPKGVLVVGPAEGLTAEQFGRNLGLFSNQILRLTHQPDPNWTPNLQDNRDPL
ncbi:MAG: hypothetical protein MUC92_12300 [Fimbriimonadaceae bacterium]|jgi:hypothetical protein|nr:hypothetical protein [Fimbriimonadaceae bacterium]